MAKQSTVDLLKTRLDEVQAETDQQHKALVTVQNKLRPDPGNVGLLNQVNEMKQRLYALADEHGDLARAVGSMSGGTNHAPLPS